MDFIKKTIAGAIAILKGMKMVFVHIFRPAITVEYPEVKDDFAVGLRGHIAVRSNEDGSIDCIDCKSCVRACPCMDLIKIDSYKDDENKVHITQFSVDIGRCIGCGNCVEACPKKVFVMSDDYEMATYDKSKLVFDVEKLKIRKDL